MYGFVFSAALHLNLHVSEHVAVVLKQLAKVESYLLVDWLPLLEVAVDHPVGGGYRYLLLDLFQLTLSFQVGVQIENTLLVAGQMTSVLLEHYINEHAYI